MIKITISNLIISSLAISIIIACDATPITQSTNLHGRNNIGNLESRKDTELDPLKAADSVELYRFGQEPSATLERPQESTTSAWTTKLAKSDSNVDRKQNEKSDMNEALDTASSKEYVISEEPEDKGQEVVYVSPPYENSPQSPREMPYPTNERPQEAYPQARNNQSIAYSYSISGSTSPDIAEHTTREVSPDSDSNQYESQYPRLQPENKSSYTYTSYQQEAPGSLEGNDGVMSVPVREEVASLAPQQNDGSTVYRSQESQPKTVLEEEEKDQERRQLEEASRNLNQVPSIDTLKLIAEATGWPATILTEVPLKDMPLHVLEKLKRDYGVKVIATRDGPDQPLNIICEELTNSDTYPCDAAKRQRLAAHIQASIVANRNNNLSFLGIPSRQDQKQQDPQSHLAEPSSENNPEGYANVESQPNQANQMPVAYQEQ